MHFIYKKRKYFSIVLQKKKCISLHFCGIYNKFVKFLKDLVNISTTLSFFFFLSLKINCQYSDINVEPIISVVTQFWTPRAGDGVYLF